MAGIYLREALIENVGPISSLDVSLELDTAGNPKPVIFVGKNGTGKTIFLSYVLDALAELAKKTFRDVVEGQVVGHSPYLKVISGGNSRSLCGISLSMLQFSDSDSKFCYIEKVGTIDSNDYTTKLRGRFEDVKTWAKEEPHTKQITGDESRIETSFKNISHRF